jgi:spermidine synthase
MLKPTILLPLLALLSGGTALVYETVWLRWFRLLFGSTAYAASATLCAFFAGLALGAYYFGRRAGKTRHPLALYARIEFGAAAASLLVPLIIQVYDPIYAALYGTLAEHQDLFVLVKFALALVAILPAATLLGGTLPVLVAAYVSDSGRLGSRGGLLYAVNTLGAAVGTGLGSLWLPERIGVQGTYAVAIGMSVAIGAVAWLLARMDANRVAEELPLADPEDHAPRSLQALAFASGFGTLAFEVLLIQALALALNNSVYSYGAVLITVLVALGSAALLVAVMPRRLPPRPVLTVMLLATAGLLLVLPGFIVGVTSGLRMLGAATFINGIWLASLFGGLVLLAGGTVLPLVFRLSEGGAAAPRLGGLLAANTVGGILGSLLASFVLLDGLGLWLSLTLLGLGYAALALLSVRSLRLRLVCAGLAALAFGALLGSPLDPLKLPVVLVEPDETLVAVAEGAHGIVSVVDKEQPAGRIDRRIRVDNNYLLSGSLANRHQRRMGHIALLLHPDPKRVLFVGSASGETASSALAHPVDEIVLVEIVPEVQALAAVHFAEANRGVYTSPRTRVVVEDGRNHVRASPERYDVIVADLFVPWCQGAGSMFSQEHFQAARDHLEPGGVFAQWLPLYQMDERQFEIIVATFLEVFPDAMLWRGDFRSEQPTAALVAIAGAPPSVEVVAAAGRRAARGGVEDPFIVDPSVFWTLYLGPLSGASDLTSTPVNTDTWPIFEFVAGRIADARLGAFRMEGWPAAVRRAIVSAGPVDAYFPERPPGLAQAGETLARANALLLHDPGQRRQAIDRVRAEVPRALIEALDETVVEGAAVFTATQVSR